MTGPTFKTPDAKHGYVSREPLAGAPDLYNPTSEDHAAHVERVLAERPSGFPVLKI